MWRINRFSPFSQVYLRRYLSNEYGNHPAPLVIPRKETDSTHIQERTDRNINILIDHSSKQSLLKMETAVEHISETDEDMRKAASFDDVPGPSSLRYISKIWSYIPLFGNQVTTSTLQYFLSAGKIFGSQLSWGNNLSIFRYLLNEYGPVVRLHGPFGGDVVILSRPEHAGVVFENEGCYPIRSSLDCVEKYRLEHRMYKLAGPFGMHGPQWEELRKKIMPALSKSLDHQYQSISLSCNDFVERVLALRNKQQEVPKTFNQEINKWCLQCLTGIMFNKKIAFLDPRGLSSTSEASVLLEALQDATEALRKCEFGFHLWKLIETPSWRKLINNCDTIDHILSNYLRKSQDQLRECREKQETFNNDKISLVDYFILKDSMLAEDILTVLLDMMLLGVNMTSNTAGFLMYHLARNPRSQHLLYKEISALPEKVTKDDLKDLKYLKACLHESLRLKPPMPVLSRVLTKDISVHGYKIPKGTSMLIATNLSSLREEHFEDAMKFKPERWTDIEVNKDLVTLASIPFGHGPKACLAKDFAEVQIYFLIIKLLRKFRIEYHYGDIESNNKLLASPTRPFKFRFVNRE